MSTKYVKYNDLECSVGNLKLGNNTLIFNMSSATDCMSRVLGKCKLGNKCYALKAENMYPGCLPFRNRQFAYWSLTDIKDIIKDFDTMLRVRRVRVNGQMVRLYETIDYFRFNEAGDFVSQEDVEKLDELAVHLMKEFNIITYGYTARNDLDYKGISFSLKGSGWHGAPNGMTVAKKNINRETTKTIINNELQATFHVCPMDCRDCTLCKTGKDNVVFPLH